MNRVYSAFVTSCVIPGKLLYNPKHCGTLPSVIDHCDLIFLLWYIIYSHSATRWPEVTCCFEVTWWQGSGVFYLNYAKVNICSFRFAITEKFRTISPTAFKNALLKKTRPGQDFFCNEGNPRKYRVSKQLLKSEMMRYRNEVCFMLITTS